MERRPLLGLPLIVVAAVLWGTWPLYVRPGGPSGLVMATLAMSVMALPAPFVVRRAAFLDRGAVVALVISGVSDALNAALYFSALERGPVVVAVLTHYLAPLLVAVFAPLIGEPRSGRALVAIALALTGLGLVLVPRASGFPATTAALGGGSAFFYAVLVLCFRRAGKSFSPLAVTSLHALVGAAVLLVAGARSLTFPALGPALWWALAGGLFNGLLAAVLFNLGLRRTSAQIAGALTYVEPLTAAAIGVIVFGEPLRLGSLAGAALILGAGLFVAIERRPAAA